MKLAGNLLIKLFSLGLVSSFILGACRTVATPTLEAQPPTAPAAEPVATDTLALPAATETPELPDIPLSQQPAFAAYAPAAIQTVALVNQPEVAAGLGNVYNPFALSHAQLGRLAENGFVISPGKDKEFYVLYERARYDNKPIFVTSDAMLHIYHLLFDKVLRTAERKYFIALLQGLNQALLAETEAQYQALKGTQWESAALNTLAFVGVSSRLLDPAVAVPLEAVDLVQAEVGLVNAAAGTLPSPLFPGLEYGEDYTQYIPRGHYTLDDSLKAYFKAMMWYGRMTFRLQTLDPETGRAETRSAILLVNALRHASVQGRPAQEVWQDLYSPTAFFVGRSDDLTVIQYGDVFDAVYGAESDPASLVDEARLTQFIDLALKLPPPKILGLVIADNENVEQVTKGMRFMGQRFVPDAYIFRELMYRNVGTSDNRRGLPKGLDLPAAMGSQRAYQLLGALGETQYANYDTQMTKMQAWLSSLGVNEWTETLYNTWIYTFYPLLGVPGDGYPLFMRSTAWQDKQLNTVLGSWTELKHDTILYAKQAYAEMGGGPPAPLPEPPKGYVEPVPEFFARLAALAAMTRTGLGERGLLDELDSQNLTNLETLVVSLQGMAEKELRGEALTDEEYELIRYIGGDLEHLTMAAADSDTEDAFAPKFLEEDPQAALVADVATDPGASPEPLVLEEAIGRINAIYVIVPLVAEDGSLGLQIAKGGVFSYYEFANPATNRLTDEAWRQMLEAGTAPAAPEWSASFMTSEGEYADVTSAVFRLQDRMTQILWEPMYSLEGLDAVFDFVRPDLVELNASKMYIGHKLISSEFRSVDLQSETKAVVTVREQWQDQLFAYSGDYPNYDEAVKHARGPYAMDMTYTIELKDGWWQVTGVVYNSQVPGWE